MSTIFSMREPDLNKSMYENTIESHMDTKISILESEMKAYKRDMFDTFNNIVRTQNARINALQQCVNDVSDELEYMKWHKRLNPLRKLLGHMMHEDFRKTFMEVRQKAERKKENTKEKPKEKKSKKD